ncbi:hypothetical protein ACIP5Y_37745 [Nocardia sp. NPDC088792]|uniref:hypothetical protein n=1 Tax=Nocardia sp. NPDC088792 TaxID=3364332 RepID=UPI0037F8635A
MTTPGLYVTHLIAPKHGCTAAECEDAVCVLPDLPFDELIEGPLAASVCDGATESVLAKDWARLLAAVSVAKALPDPGFFAPGTAYEEFAAEVVGRWDPWLAEYAGGRAAAGRPLRWYEQAKLAGSTFATMLTVRVAPGDSPGGPEAEAGATPEWHWHAAALGDSCLFHIRDEALIRSFPIESAEDFGTTPDLFGSRNHDTALLTARTRFDTGTCLPGDRLLLMSDALAAWLLAAGDPGAALRELLEFGGPHDTPGFAEWLGKLRARQDLRNDDVALIRIDVEGR